MPLAVIVTAFGTVMVRLCTLRLNVPGTLKAARSPAGSVRCWSAVSRLTWTSKVPTMPWRFALKPLEPPLPNESEASATPIWIVRSRMPLLKEVPARPTVGPWSESGPSEIGVLAAPGPVVADVTVKLPTPL